MMRIANAGQAKALRRFLDVLTKCSDATFLTLDGDVFGDSRTWKRERNSELQKVRRDLIQSGIDVPDEWLRIEVPNYSFQKRPDSIVLRGSPGTVIASAIEQMGLLLLRWEAVSNTVDTVRDSRLEARDKWIYNQCCKPNNKYSTIARQLKDNGHGWPLIKSAQGIKKAAERYAARHKSKSIPKRSRGRKPNSN